MDDVTVTDLRETWRAAYAEGFADGWKAAKDGPLPPVVVPADWAGDLQGYSAQPGEVVSVGGMERGRPVRRG